MAAAFAGMCCGLAVTRCRVSSSLSTQQHISSSAVSARVVGRGRDDVAPRFGAAAGGLLAILGAVAAPLWRRPGGDRGARGVGRIVVRGRNYETNIKKKKGPAELKKAKITAKHLRAVVAALRSGLPDESNNAQLARAIKAGLKDNVPRSTIDNRIKTFVEGKEVVDEMEIQGYGSGGTAVIVQCVTDNTTRTRNEVREAFKDCNGQVGNDGSVDHCFNKCGVIRFDDADEEAVMEASMEADVEDCVGLESGGVEVITLPSKLHATLDILEKEGYEASSSGVEFRPLSETGLGKEGTYNVKRLLFLLEQIDDVTEVHHTGVFEDGVELLLSNYGIPFSYERSLKG